MRPRIPSLTELTSSHRHTFHFTFFFSFLSTKILNPCFANNFVFLFLSLASLTTNKEYSKHELFIECISCYQRDRSNILLLFALVSIKHDKFYEIPSVFCSERTIVAIFFRILLVEYVVEEVHMHGETGNEGCCSINKKISINFLTFIATARNIVRNDGLFFALCLISLSLSPLVLNSILVLFQAYRSFLRADIQYTTAEDSRARAKTNQRRTNKRKIEKKRWRVRKRWEKKEYEKEKQRNGKIVRQPERYIMAIEKILQLLLIKYLENGSRPLFFFFDNFVSAQMVYPYRQLFAIIHVTLYMVT